MYTASGGVLSTASDDEVGGFHARLREVLNRGRCDVSRTLTGTARGAHLSVTVRVYVSGVRQRAFSQ